MRGSKLYKSCSEHAHAPGVAPRAIRGNATLFALPHHLHHKLAPHPFLTSGLILSLAAIPRLSVGLDQAVALPRDSYLQDYFR
jgi:hypothetical protein